MANATAALQAAAVRHRATSPFSAPPSPTTAWRWTLTTSTAPSAATSPAPPTWPPLEQAGRHDHRSWFPEAQKVGLLYCSAEPNSALSGRGGRRATWPTRALRPRNSPSPTPTTLPSVTQAACDGADVIYVPTDNTAASNTEAIANVIVPAGVPGYRRRGGHLLRLRRGYPVHQLLRSGRDHRRRWPPRSSTGEADISTMPIEYDRPSTQKYNAAHVRGAGHARLPDGYHAPSRS